jgi:hypothetical protein
MNDPMEGYFIPRGSKNEISEDHQLIFDKIRYNATELGLACFSESYESELMWAHYAGNYSGVCVGYSTKELVKGLPADVSLVKIAYVDEPPKLSATQKSRVFDAARIVLSLKKSNWAYEHEWRLISVVGKNPYSTQAVRSINFGARVDQSVRHQFISKLTNLNIKFYQMTVAGYKHDWSLM